MPDPAQPAESLQCSSITMAKLDEIAKTFLQIWQTKTFSSGDRFDITSMTVEDAYAVQRKVIEHREALGESVAGYKVGCTSNAIRQQFALSEPMCGCMMLPHIYHGEPVLNWHNYADCAVEPEFVICMGREVTDHVSDEKKLLDAIEWVAPGIEVHNYRFWFGAPTAQELVATNGIHAGLVVGEPRAQPGSLNFDLEGIGMFRNGELMASGIGADVMGGPLKSLRWLANHLIARGDSLRPGQLVIPGSPVKLVSVHAQDRMTATFTNLGSVSVIFSDNPGQSR